MSEILRYSPDYQPRSAQEEAFRWAESEQALAQFEADREVRKRVEVCTGDGKTLINYGVFGILSARGLVDRNLVFVPGDEQRMQFADDEKDARNLLGLNIAARVVNKSTADLRSNRRGDEKIFVATYAQLTEADPDDCFFQDLLSSGHRWMLTPDEYHHLGLGNTFAKRLESLRARMRLYMSGTPIRSDRRDCEGVPTDPASLLCKSDYKLAYGQQSVKRLICCNEHYQVMCETDRGPEPVTTNDLKKAQIKDFKTYEAKKQLRYHSDYLCNLLTSPCQSMAQKRVVNPAQDGRPMHQMLCFAMTCHHASYICDSMKSVIESLGIGFTCDWVGIGDGFDGARRSDSENADIIGRFRQGKLDILVSVDKVGEGFSMKTISTEIFLNLIGADNKLLQEVGRSLRRNPKIPFEQDIAHIFCGSDSAVADLVRSMEAQAPGDERERTGGGGGGGGRLIDIPDLTVISADHDHREIVSPVQPSREQIAEQLSAYDLKFCEKNKLDPVDFFNFLSGRTGRSRTPLGSIDRSSRERLDAIKSQVKNATGILVGNIVRILRSHDRSPDKVAIGNLHKKVNGEWLRRSYGKTHEVMVEEEWRVKYAWLKEENAKLIMSGSLPSWLN